MAKAIKEKVNVGTEFDFGADTYEATAEGVSGRLKPTNLNGSNIFVVTSSRVLFVLDHYIPRKDDNKLHSLCGVHEKSGMNGGIVRQAVDWGAADDCVICAYVKGLFRTAKELDDVKKKRMQNAAGDLKLSARVFLEGCAGTVLDRKDGGKRIVKPQFEGSALSESGVIEITWAAWKIFQDEFQREGYEPSELVGLPFDLFRESTVGDKKGAREFSKVTRVKFFRDYRIAGKDLPKPRGLVGALPGSYDPDGAETALKAYDRDILPVLLAGKDSPAGKKKDEPAKKSAKKSAKKK